MLRRTAAAAAPNQRADEGRDEGDAGCTVRLHGNGWCRGAQQWSGKSGGRTTLRPCAADWSALINSRSTGSRPASVCLCVSVRSSRSVSAKAIERAADRTSVIWSRPIAAVAGRSSSGNYLGVDRSCQTLHQLRWRRTHPRALNAA